MAGFNYISAQKTASKLLKKFGVETTIGEVTETYDPVEGTTFPGTIAKATVTVINLPPSNGIAYFGNRYKEELVKGSVRFFYLDAKGLELILAPGFIIFWDGAIWDVDGTTPLNPAGTKLLYVLGCTKSQKSNDLLDLPETPSCKDGLAIVTNDWPTP